MQCKQQNHETRVEIKTVFPNAWQILTGFGMRIVAPTENFRQRAHLQRARMHGRNRAAGARDHHAVELGQVLDAHDAFGGLEELELFVGIGVVVRVVGLHEALGKAHLERRIARETRCEFHGADIDTITLQLDSREGLLHTRRWHRGSCSCV